MYISCFFPNNQNAKQISEKYELARPRFKNFEVRQLK